MTGVHNGQAINALQVAATNTVRVNSGYWTAGEIDSLADLCPDPSVAKKKLNVNLCKKGKGRADQERSESFTFIDDVKVVLLKIFFATNVNSSTKWVLDLGTWSQSILALHNTQAVITELHAQSAYDAHI